MSRGSQRDKRITVINTHLIQKSFPSMKYIKKEKKTAVVNMGDNPKIIFVDSKKIRMSEEEKYYIVSEE